MKNHDSFYDSSKWHKLTSRVLRRDKYCCQYFKRLQLVPVKATIVHHVFPKKYFPEFQYSEWNLISLSAKAHNKMHNRDSDKLTDEGIKLLIRVAKKNKINYKLLIQRMK